MSPASRASLWRWAGWFAAANTALYLLVGSRYLLIYQFPPDALGTAYALLASVGQFAVLACVPILLVASLVILLWPRRAAVMAVSVAVAAVSLTLLVLDTNVFAQYRFHLTRLTMALFETGTWVFAGLLLAILLAFQAMLAGSLWRWLAAAPSRGGRALGALLAACWLGGTGLHIWADAVAHAPVTQFTRFLPLYYPIHAKRDLARLGLVDPEAVRRRRMTEGSLDLAGGQLRYPIEALQCAAGNGPKNLLIVLIDALRPDAIDPALLPHISRFRGGAVDFRTHYSGGNSSRMGIFSLFYGLPSTYWQSFYDLQQPPVLMNRLRAGDYEFGLFSAVGFGSPTLIDRTVFAGMAELPDEDPALSVTERNLRAADDWLAWLGSRDPATPFFGFVYFDPPMNDMPEAGAPLPLDDRFAAGADVRKRWHQYRLAMRVIDTQVGRVLDALEREGLADDTVVMLTSDHGYEFDDNGLGYVGHAGNFSRAQLQATLLLRWPGRPAAQVTRRTSHHDVPVTLLEDLLGCQNPPADYAVGQNLFAGNAWDWIIAGSYSSHAIVEPERTVVSYPGGFVEVLGPDYRPAANAALEPAVVEASMQQMRRFFQ